MFSTGRKIAEMLVEADKAFQKDLDRGFDLYEQAIAMIDDSNRLEVANWLVELNCNIDVLSHGV